MFSLETDRLILRDLLETDFQPFYDLCCQPEVTKYQDFLRVENEAKALEMLKEAYFYNNLIPRGSYSLAIIRKQGEEWIGWIGLGNTEDPSLGDMQFGYAIHPKYWGYGYMTEALHRVVDFCFRDLGIGKIYGGCDLENVTSARVMEKAGLRLERSCQVVDEATGQLCDGLYFCMTRDEWACKYGSSVLSEKNG
jgi:ribosomal-protein-alanine N-acetyltransferase